MSDPVAEKIRAWNDRAALIRHAWQAFTGVIIVSGGIAITYSTLAGDVKDAKERSERTERAVQAITGQLNALDTNQKVMQSQMENQQRNSAAFQMRTDTALDRILNKLDDLQKKK